MYGTCLTLWEQYEPDKQQQQQQQLYLPKCLVILSTYPYLAAFREFLTQLTRMIRRGEMTLPVERHIVNFCSEIPAPPPGSFEVQTTILDSVIRIWSPPHNLPITWVSLPFAHLFECLDIDNVILVWHCLILERQVLITSTQLSLLTIASEIFLSLLFPMRWSHAYIPVLPTFLIPILSAPMPFLCGINKTNLADALFDLSTECVLVDLDKNTVTFGPDTAPLPPLPPSQEAVLRAQLEDNAEMVFREARSLRKLDDYSENGSNLPEHTKVMAEAMWESKLCLFDEAFHLFFTPEEIRKNLLNGNDSSGLDLSDRDMSDLFSWNSADRQVRKQSPWDAVQEAFLNTFVYLLRNYRKYLVFPSKHNEGSYGGAGFRSKEFIESQRFDMRDILEQLIGTQMFDNFITKRLYGSGEADVAFFDMAVDSFLKNAGIFADVDLSGRIMDNFKTDKYVSHANLSRPRHRTRPSASILAKFNDNPLLQSAKVHRMLKTIVPPEPTGDGLPPSSEILMSYSGVSLTKSDDADDVSIQSGSTTGTSTRRAKDKEKEVRYSYPVFPSTLDERLFGEPRPLPAAVIAEFDRQRKDAAQFRRRGQRQPKDQKKHIQRAHATVDPITPPSPEVATFTLFFMAFASLVGKDLIDFSHDPEIPEKTILSTYVPTTRAESDSEKESANEENSSEEVVDEKEQEGVTEMKAFRPQMGGMFGDDGDATYTKKIKEGPLGPQKSSAENGDNVKGNPEVIDLVDKEDIIEVAEEEDTSNARSVSKESKEDTEDQKSNTMSEPRQRFRDKLSDLQIEEAKAKGRAQLGLAFEILTMMKKRALKADPEAYQSLIDACGRVGDTKRATDLLSKMHEDGIVADGTVYACLVSAFSAETSWKGKGTQEEDLPEWANSTAVEMDWNKLQRRSILDRLVGSVVDLDDDDDDDDDGSESNFAKLRRRILKSRAKQDASKGISTQKSDDSKMEFFVTETVERQIALGENLLEIVFPDISVDTENEVCPRCNYLLSDDDVVSGWNPGNMNDYTTSCPNCTQRFVPHFCVQSSAPAFVGSRGPASPLMCERLSPWVLQKEIRSVMSDREGMDNLLDPQWREREYKNSVLWWNLVLSCMRYRLPFSFLLQGSFQQNLIAPLPEDES